MYNEIKHINEYTIAVTNRHLCSGPLEIQIQRVCAYQPKAIVLREKDMSEEKYQSLAEKVIRICDNHKVLCILHSFVDVAKRLNHKAIHLPLPLLRVHHEDLAAFSIVGTSIHSLKEAKEAKGYGADYIVAGHIYATDCKKGATPKGLGFLADICAQAEMPVYAIGGIKLDKSQMQELLDCGARGGFVMSEMMKLV